MTQMIPVLGFCITFESQLATASFILRTQTHLLLFRRGLGDSQREFAIWLCQSVHAYTCVLAILAVCVHTCMFVCRAAEKESRGLPD